MPPDASLSESPPASRGGRPDATTEWLWAIHQRLAHAEEDLRIQFTRIAQLQAQVDLLLAALRRSPGGAQAMSVGTHHDAERAS